MKAYKINSCIFALLLILFSATLVQGYLPPFSERVDSVENNPSCLQVSRDEVRSYCPNEYTYYDKASGRSVILINCDEYYKNRETYSELFKEGKEYRCTVYLRETSFRGPFAHPAYDPDAEPSYYDPTYGPSYFEDCLVKNQFDQWAMEGNPGTESWRYVIKEEIINGVNVCDGHELREAGYGTVVKYWTATLVSRDENPDVIIKGHTYYTGEPIVIFPFILIFSMLLFLASIVLFINKKIPLALFIALLVLSGMIFFFGTALIIA